MTKIIIVIGIIFAALLILGAILYLVIAHFMLCKVKKTSQKFFNDFKFKRKWTSQMSEALNIGEAFPKPLNVSCDCCGNKNMVFDEVIIGDKKFKVCHDCSKTIKWFCKHVGEDKP